MSKTSPGRVKRTGSTNKSTTITTNTSAERTSTTGLAISHDRRHSMIAESAYLRAAARGFTGGDPVADWLDSEREVDALLSKAGD